MNNRIFLLIFLSILDFGVNGYREQQNSYWPNSPEQNQVDDNQNYFNSSISNLVAKNVFDLSRRLTEKILETSTKKFEVLSPISISAALHLALLGANRDTYDELYALLGYNDGKL